MTIREDHAEQSTGGTHYAPEEFEWPGARIRAWVASGWKRESFAMVERGRAQPAFGSRASWFEGQR